MLLMLAALLAMFTPGAARAWTEARPSGLVTELTVDRDGGAIVALRIRWTVLGGRMHQFDVADLPTDLALLEASAVAGNGTAVPVTTRAPSAGRLEVNLGDEAHGVRRGTVDVLIRYSTSLRAQGAIRRAGSEAVLEVSTVPWSRGIEGVELRVALPSSARRAQWIANETLGVEASTATELSRDVVHAHRRQLPANERWIARIAVDPAVFPWLSSGVAHRPVVLRRVQLPYDDAALVALAMTLALGLFARHLARSAPAPTDGARRRIATSALALVGVAAQSLHVVHVPFALSSGTLLLAIAAALRLPPVRVRATAPLGRITARTVSEKDLRALSPMRLTRLRAAANALALTASIAAVAASAQGVAWAAVVAADLALALVVWTAWSSRVDSLPDAAVLLPVGLRVRSLVRGGERARVSWRVRGDLRAGGDLSLRVVALPGWRQARGLRAVECSVIESRTALGVTRSPELSMRLEPGSPMERAVRVLASRVGSVTTTPDGDGITYRASLLGADGDVALRGLREMLSELFVKSPSADAKSCSLTERMVDRPTAQ